MDKKNLDLTSFLHPRSTRISAATDWLDSILNFQFMKMEGENTMLQVMLSLVFKKKKYCEKCAVMLQNDQTP